MNKYPTFEIIKDYYEKGYYTNYHLKEYCRAGYITEQQYTSLTGKAFWESVD